MPTTFLNSDRTWMLSCATCGQRFKDDESGDGGEPRVHRMTTHGRKAYHFDHQPDEAEIAT